MGSRDTAGQTTDSYSRVKLHIGSGTVYLREWVNVDLPLPHVYLAKERNDLVEQFITTEDKYYARHENKTAGTLRSGPVTKDTVCDVYGSFAFMPTRPGTASEILSRQVFEHLDRTEAKEALRKCHEALQSGGLLRLDVPDPDATLREYQRSGDEFYIRHLFGPRRDVYGFHTHYTRRMLTELVQSHGFKLLAEEQNIHWYPAFCLRFSRLE